MIEKSLKVPSCDTFDSANPGQVEGRTRFVGMLHGVPVSLWVSPEGGGGLRRFLEFFLSMHSALELPLEDLSGQSNAFRSSMISGLTSMMSSS